MSGYVSVSTTQFLRFIPYLRSPLSTSCIDITRLIEPVVVRLPLALWFSQFYVVRAEKLGGEFIQLTQGDLFSKFS